MYLRKSIALLLVLLLALSFSFLIKSFDHLNALLAGGIGDGLKARYAENNIQVLAWHNRDVRNFSSNKPVATPADVAGMKLRLPGMTTYVEAWSYLNATSTTVSMSELYTALQTGVAEASEGGYEQMTTLKLYEVQDHVSETQHVFEFVGLFISKELYDSMSEAQQKVLNDCAVECMAYADQLSEEKRADYKKQCVDGGMAPVEVDREAFVEALSEFHKSQFGTKWTGTTYDEVMSYAK